MQRVVALGQCIKVRTNSAHKLEYNFHFWGWFLGEKIKSIAVVSERSLDIIEGEEYLLMIDPREIKRGVLFSSIIKYTPVRNMFFP